MAGKPGDGGNSPTEVPSGLALLIQEIAVDSPVERGDLAHLLARIKDAFGCSAAGLASFPAGDVLCRVPEAMGSQDGSWPWKKDASLVNRIVSSAWGLAENFDGKRWVFAPVADPESSWILWVEESSGSDATRNQALWLFLLAQVMGRRLSQPGHTPWVHQLTMVQRKKQVDNVATVVGQLAHDFGNVLTGIMGFTELAMLQQMPAQSPVATYLQEVQNASQAGADFTQQLRMFARRQPSSSRPTRVQLILDEQRDRLIKKRPDGVTVSIDVPAELPQVKLDYENLQKIVGSLLDNALDAIQGPGRISISGRTVDLNRGNCMELYGSPEPGPHVELTITDTGRGMPAEVKKAPFANPFFTGKQKKRGFGLATCYGILQSIRGGIQFSYPEEGGVSVRILLPVAGSAAIPLSQTVGRIPASQAQGAKPKDTAPPPPQKKILIVDDEPAILSVISKTLEQTGFRTVAVDSAEKAMDAFYARGSDPFHLVVADVVMPGMSGTELVRKILRVDPQVRVLFISGQVTREITDRDFSIYGFDLLPKPFSPDQLILAVRGAIEKSRSALVSPTSKGQVEKEVPRTGV